MAKKAPKKANLSIAKVKKASKLIDETIPHIIEEGVYKGEQITFQPQFDDLKIEELLVNFGNIMTEADENGIEISQQVENYLVQMLIVKYFTHFRKDIPSVLLGNDNSIGMLDALEHFRKTGLLLECMNNMFSPEEVRLVYDRLTDFSARGLLALDLNDETSRKFSQLKLKNQDIYDQLGKMKTDID
jgi:hypothetical protein